ncbi:MAG: hypothetical protein FWH11_11150 [Micrococcales bacterium]|nr:hypothetical protein [Micrococcales bacterium]
MTRHLTVRALPVLAAAVLAATLAGCTADPAQTQATAGAPQTQPGGAPETSSPSTVSAESVAGSYEYFDSVLSDGTYYSDYLASLPEGEEGDMPITPVITLGADMTVRLEWADGSGSADGTWKIVDDGFRMHADTLTGAFVVDGDRLIIDTDDEFVPGARTIYQRVAG